jgi:hypothetical protein
MKRKTQETHGKTPNFKKTTLEQIYGDTGLSKYKTLDRAEYEQQLREMSKADLQNHSANVGILPKDDPETMRKKLLAEFCSYASQFKRPQDKVKEQTILSKTARSILSEGR